jgi:uncharacterized protein
VIVVDTTVLVYASGAEHPLRERCRRLLAAVAEGHLAATTTAAVVQEYLHVRGRRRARRDASRLAGRFHGLLAPLLAPAESHVDVALGLYESHEPLDAFDAFLAAAALDAGARALVSADRAFRDVPGLRYVDPGSRELDELLAG